jgi:hypothetical protein
MPIPTPRPSLTTDLATRYATQRVGGAFNDKNIIESGVDALFASFQSAQFQTKNGFLTKVQQGVSDFKGEGKDLSIYVQGLSVVPYDSSFPS